MSFDFASFDPQKLSADDVERIRVKCVDDLNQRDQTEPLTWKRLLAYKNRSTPQKFSPYFESQWRNILGLNTYDGSIYSDFDAEDEFGNTYELHYATYSISRGASFPQALRLDSVPTYHIWAIFFGDDLEVYQMLGQPLHSSIIAKTATRAHAKNANELRINIKKDTPQMAYLKRHRSGILEAKFKNHLYTSPEV